MGGVRTDHFQHPFLTDQQTYHDDPEAVRPPGTEYPEAFDLRSVDAAPAEVISFDDISLQPRYKACKFWMIMMLFCLLAISITIGGAIARSVR